MALRFWMCEGARSSSLQGEACQEELALVGLSVRHTAAPHSLRFRHLLQGPEAPLYQLDIDDDSGDALEAKPMPCRM